MTCAALALSGAATASADLARDDVPVMAWKVVGGPWRNTNAGQNQCKIEASACKTRTWEPDAGCLFDADGNQWFLSANA